MEVVLLYNNPIANKSCPLQPESICKFDY
jgi:hypothetical protein